MRVEKARVWSILLFLGLAVGLWLLIILNSGVKVVKVKTFTAETTDICSSVTAYGTVVDSGGRDVGQNTSGRVVKVYVKAGDRVKQGQVLYEGIETQYSYGGVAALTPEMEEALALMGLEQRDITALLNRYSADSPAAREEGERYYVTSPIEGVLTELNVEVNDYVPLGFVSAVVSDLKSLDAVINISESNISLLQTGLSAEISGEGFSGLRHGIVSHIMPTASETSTLTSGGNVVIKATVRITDSDETIRPGYSVKAVIYTTRKLDAVVIPYEAVIQNDEGQEIIYVLTDGKAEKRIVMTGKETPDMLEITGGLKGGERVILEPWPEELKEAGVVVSANEDS